MAEEEAQRPEPDELDPGHTRKLLSRMRAGDESAELVLYERLRSFLLERVRRHKLHARLAGQFSDEDIVQDVFTRCLASGVLDDFVDRGPGSLNGLVWVALDRTMHSWLRHMKAKKRGANRPVRSLDSGPDPESQPPAPPGDFTTPTSNARVHEYRDIIEEVLTAREWAVWRLMEGDGLNGAEAAQRLGVSAVTANRIFRDAQQRIIRALARRDDTRARRKNDHGRGEAGPGDGAGPEPPSGETES